MAILEVLLVDDVLICRHDEIEASGFRASNQLTVRDPRPAAVFRLLYAVLQEESRDP
ncbi:MAG: hypothetical protein NTZ56_05770 [Acidobacteria bacterium]|nr:hypothetical protein [Acidobacteriota bacterium]